MTPEEWQQFMKDQDYRTTCPNLPIADSLIKQGERLAQIGQIREAIAAYKEAQTLDPAFEISAFSWNNLCWLGSTWGYAAEVLGACEKAVDLASEQNDGWLSGYRDSRGLARALTGDTKGAIDDFQAFTDSPYNVGYKAKRQGWVEALQSGEDPFTQEVLEALRTE